MANIKLTVVSAEAQIFEGEVKYLQASGTEGELGILPHHTPLFTTIKPGVLKFTLMDNSEQIVYVSGGFLEVQPTEIIVLADVAIRGEDLDRERILEAKRQAEENIKAKSADQSYDLLMAQLAKELAKLKAYELTEKLVQRNR